MTTFPVKPLSNFTLDDLTSYLIEIKNTGLNVYQDPNRTNKFDIVLNQSYTVRCIFNGVNKCQVQHLKYDSALNFHDVESKVQLEEVVTEFIRKTLGSYPSVSTSARLSADTPATNFNSISTLIGNSEITAIFDPYLENLSLSNLITICSFGDGTISNNVRLLGSSKKAGGNNPTFTLNGVSAFNTETGVAGTAKVMGSNSEHRRFMLLSGGKSLLLGHSLNAIHKNEALRVESDTEDLAFFDTIWTSATSL